MEGPDPAKPDGHGRRALAVDAVAAVTLAAVGAYAVIDPPGPAYTGPWWAACLVAGATALPFAVRRRWPRGTLAVLLVAAVSATAAGVVGTGVIWVTYLPTMVALYSVAADTKPVWSVPAVALCLGGSLAAIVYLYVAVLPASVAGTTGSEVPLYWQVETGIVWVLMCTPWAVGLAVRWRRAVTARLAAQVARTAVADERLRIARELHDIVGHSLSVITVKATVANHLADSRPDETRAALGVIEHTSRHALAEVRRVLGVLRTDADAETDLTPAPGLAQLPTLVETARSAGVDVELRMSGTYDLTDAADLSVYRIVQEALTNVVTHAAPTHCRVVVTTAGDAVHVEVVDDGPADRPTGHQRSGGRGLVGMRERVHLFGGDLDASPRPEDGFRVAARLPHRAEGGS